MCQYFTKRKFNDFEVTERNKDKLSKSFLETEDDRGDEYFKE